MAPAPDTLTWQSQWGFQTATIGSCFYLRESAGSIIAGFVFSVVFSVPTCIYGIWLLFTEPLSSSWVFAAMLLLVSAVFSFVLWTSLRRGRWMIVYDRGRPGAPGEIRYNGKRLAADRVRHFTTQYCGGRTPTYTVRAALHDGTFETLGPVGNWTWTQHWAATAATWMGLPFLPGKTS